MTQIEWDLAGLRPDPVVNVPALLHGPVAPTLVGDRLVWDQWPKHPGPVAERMAIKDYGQPDPWTGADGESRLLDSKVWWGPFPGRYSPFQPVPPDLLARFITLENASAAAILRFASSWGPLDLCAHGLPCFHSAAFHDDFRSCQARSGWGTNWEDLAAWRGHAARARAILSIAADICRGDGEKAGDWQALARFTAHPGTPNLMAMRLDPAQREAYKRAQSESRRRILDLVGTVREDALDCDGDDFSPAMRETAIQDVMHTWLRDGGVKLSFRWRNGRASLTLDHVQLYGVLGYQLLMAITCTDGLASCAGCGDWFLGGRVGGRGRNRYCPTCGRRGSTRDASRRYREKKRQAHVKGRSAASAPAHSRAHRSKS